MLGLLCPECSIVKISPPALGPRVCIRVFYKTTSISWNIAWNMPKVHWQTIYCGKFTVEDT